MSFLSNLLFIYGELATLFPSTHKTIQVCLALNLWLLLDYKWLVIMECAIIVKFSTEGRWLPVGLTWSCFSLLATRNSLWLQGFRKKTRSDIVRLKSWTFWLSWWTVCLALQGWPVSIPWFWCWLDKRWSTWGGIAENVVGLLALVYSASDANFRQSADVVVGSTQNADNVFTHNILFFDLQPSHSQCSCRL